VIPPLDAKGKLPAGIYYTDWQEFTTRYATSCWQRRILDGLIKAADALRQAGCPTIYINGSFITGKRLPGDFDACWEEDGVNWDSIDEILLTFDHLRTTQNAHFLGELFPAHSAADDVGSTFLEFFQRDRDDQPKGIIAINLREEGQ
jgi:hypothetical protein